MFKMTMEKKKDLFKSFVEIHVCALLAGASRPVDVENQSVTEGCPRSVHVFMNNALLLLHYCSKIMLI